MRFLLFILLIFHGIPSEAQAIDVPFTRALLDFEFEGIQLSGVLLLPENPKGIVMIVHGSGSTNAVAQEWYLDVRETMLQSGYGTYIWDKRGCGNSGGTFDYNQTVANSALEVIAAINTLKQKKILGSDKIGLWGISRAGWISPIIINQYPDIKFWISVSGVDDKENFNYLFQENLRINGILEDTIRLLSRELKEGVRLTHTGANFEVYMNATRNLRKNNFWNRFNNGTVITEKGYYAYQKTFMHETLDQKSGLQIYVEDFDTLLSNINCPVLALFGEQDNNIDWKKTKDLYQNTIGESTNLTINSFQNCNHNLYQCKTGGFYEFQDDQLPWDRCDGFLEAIENWLNNLEE